MSEGVTAFFSRERFIKTIPGLRQRFFLYGSIRDDTSFCDFPLCSIGPQRPPAEAVQTDAQGSNARPLLGPLDTLVAVIGSTAFCVV
jgi:hypothetical protein